MLPGTNVSTNPSVSNPRIFYGWFVVAGTFAVTFVGFGCAYSFSAFLPPFEINPNAMALGGVLCVVLGLLAGLVPALSAMNLRITDALRRN